ncbi:PREDICTED: ABC transporter F family member 4-like [Branchiostoma belcheri]|uniref:ABC transporter F family member 4-like n=1 Tax=Branchiostoma belcheri TaxID=7741 RepID=A0A6P5AWK0_BRABE|nr:PREDICTED: ABC transporter F family member 4-like [Branchiostoma belcheri]
MAEFSDQDDLPELSACYQQHIQQIVDVLDESEVSDSEAQSDREKDESSDSTENSEDWEESSATVSRVSRLMCSQPVNVMQQCDQVAAGTTEDMEVAPLLDFSDSESESLVFYQDTSPQSPHSPLLGYASEENEHQDLEEQASSDNDEEVREEELAKNDESSQEEEDSSAEEEEKEEEEEEEDEKGEADSTSSTTAHSEVDPKHNLRASNTERKDGPQDDRKRRREPTRFSSYQLEQLERVYKLDPYPDSSKKAAVAVKLNINLGSVRNWFSNRRTRRQSAKPRLKSTRGRRMVPKPEAVDSPRNSSTDRMKRTKGWFSPDQVEELEKSFQQFGPYPEASVQAQLAKKLNTKPAKVYNWMNRRRFKWRKCGEPRLNVGTSRKRSCPNPPDTPSKTTKSSQDDSTRLTRKRKKEEEEAVKAGRGRKLTRELRSLLPSVGSPKQEKEPQTVENLLQDMLTKTKPRQLKPAQDSSPEVEETERTGKRGKQKRQRRKIDNSCFQEPPDTPSDTLPDLGHQKPPNTPSDTRKPGRARKVSEKSRSAAQTQEQAATSGTHDVFPRPEGVNSDDEDLMSKRSCCNLKAT